MKFKSNLTEDVHKQKDIPPKGDISVMWCLKHKNVVTKAQNADSNTDIKQHYWSVGGVHDMLRWSRMVSGKNQLAWYSNSCPRCF